MDESATIARMLSKASYKYHDLTKKDVLNTIKFYKGLQPKLEKFTFPNGKEQQLIALNGTIPVTFRSNVYHIPVCIFLNKDHPSSAPMCYVRPTPNMLIKASNYVNHEGKVLLPYLQDWEPETSDLLGVIQVMICIFGETPPVYQKPKDVVALPPQSPYSTPYPTQSYPRMPVPPPSMMPTASTGSNFVTTPPYPNLPYPPYPSEGYPPNSTPYSSYPQTNVYPPMPQNSQASNSTGTITEEHLRDSLVSALIDNLKVKVRERLDKTQAEIDALRNTYWDLSWGKKGVDKIVEQMKTDLSELEICKRQLKMRREQIDDLLQHVEKDLKKHDIDDAFGPQEPLYKQLLNAFAEENATVDAIYYLGEALKREVIDLDVFLKNVRELSRRQFMLRALMQKCREKAGLPY